MSILILICMAFPAMSSGNQRVLMAKFFKEPSAVNFGQSMATYHNLIRLSQSFLIIATILFVLIGIVAILQHFQQLKTKLPLNLLSKIVSTIMLLSAIMSLVSCLLYIQNISTHLTLGLSSILAVAFALVNCGFQWFGLKKNETISLKQ